MPKYKILVVEDEDDTLKFLKQTLARALRCQVDTASCADEGINKLLEGDYTLVVLDIKMPQKSGLDFLREIKAKNKLPKILIVSGYDDEYILQEVLEAGALDYIPKPVVPDILVRKAKVLLDIKCGGDTE